LVRFGPDIEILAADGVGGLKLLRRFRYHRLAVRVLWGVWRRLPVVGRSAPLPVLAWAWLAERIVARTLPRCDIYHGLTGVCLASLRAARRMGAATVVETTMLHPAAWQREVLADCAEVRLRASACERLLPAAQIRRQEREFREAGTIIVYSPAAARSFQEFPYFGKVVVVEPGVDHHHFSPASETCTEHPFRVCFVGRFEAAKGVHRLLQAWRCLALPDAELVLAGRILPEMDHLRAAGLPANVRLAGILSFEEIADLYRQSDLFVFPSVNEGLPIAVLEAMSSGLPVIACAGTGAAHCITAGKDGLLVAPRNSDAIAIAIQWCYNRRDQLAGMGKAARLRIEEHFTLPHYYKRVLDLYRVRAGENREE
jgi:glycosyltransferase involved in cell wall biosynthesis